MKEHSSKCHREYEPRIKRKKKKEKIIYLKLAKLTFMKFYFEYCFFFVFVFGQHLFSYCRIICLIEYDNLNEVQNHFKLNLN